MNQIEQKTMDQTHIIPGKTGMKLMITGWLYCLIPFLFASVMWLPETAANATTGESSYRIIYATYFGGQANEEAREIILLPDGSILIGAQTCSLNMPVTHGVIQSHYAGDDPALGHPGIYGGDCYLLHLSNDGQMILAATYFGGSKQERNVYGMELDSQNNIVIATTTRSLDAPTTTGSFQPKYAGGQNDMLAAKITSDLKRIIWCTYIGGSSDETPRGGLMVDKQDNVYVVGTTNSSDFPTSDGVVQRNLRGPSDSAIVKLKPDGSDLVFSTFLGGTGDDDAIMGIRYDTQGNLYVAGYTQSEDFPISINAAQKKLGGKSDCYLAKLTNNGSRILYATYLGGHNNEFAEHRPWLTSDGSFLISGFCESPDFLTTSGAVQPILKGEGDGFLTMLSSDGKRFSFSTLLGGTGGENWLMPTLDDKGSIYIVGSTSSKDFPVTPNALQKTYGGGPNDGAFAIFNTDASQLLYASYLGGSGDDLIRSITLGKNGEVYLFGKTSSTDFPVTTNAIQKKNGGEMDAFMVKLSH